MAIIRSPNAPIMVDADAFRVPLSANALAIFALICKFDTVTEEDLVDWFKLSPLPVTREQVDAALNELYKHNLVNNDGANNEQ